MYFWGFVVIGFLFSTVVIVTSVTDPDDRTWILGLVTALLMNGLLLLLPYIRGYPIYGRADVLTHVGRIKVIFEAAAIGGSNFYPNTHLMAATAAFATGLEPSEVVTFIPPVFSILYFGSMYFLLTRLFESRRRVLLGLPFVALPLMSAYHVQFLPYQVTVLFTPFVLFLFLKQQRTGAPPVRAALAAAILAFVVYHPLATMFLLIFFAVWLVAKHLPLSRMESKYVRPTSVASITLAGFVAWYYNFTGMIIRFEIIYNTVFGTQEGTAPIQDYGATVSRTSPELIDLVRIAVFRYGLGALLLLLGGFFVLAMTTLWIRRRFEPDFFTVVFSVMMISFGIGAAGFLVIDLIVGMDRPLAIAKIFATLLVGGLFYLLLRERDLTQLSGLYRLGFNASLAVVIIVVVSLATFTLYPSPMGSEKNQQVTEMELDGTAWTFDHRNVSVSTDEIGIAQRRFFDAHEGRDAPNVITSGDDTTPPARFNYTTRQYLGQSYEEDHYLMITELGRVTYPAQFPEYRRFWRYTPENFDRLNRDETVSQVYDNGEFDLYRVQSREFAGALDAA
jgi:hypothetical protein